MKKRYIFIFISIVMIIAYFDLVDSCHRVDCMLSEMLKLDPKIHAEVDNVVRITKIFGH